MSGLWPHHHTTTHSCRRPFDQIGPKECSGRRPAGVAAVGLVGLAVSAIIGRAEFVALAHGDVEGVCDGHARPHSPDDAKGKPEKQQHERDFHGEEK